MDLRLSELQSRCRELGLYVPQHGKRPGKCEHVEALRQYYLRRDYPETKATPYKELNPMVCFDFRGLSSYEQEKVFRDDSDFVAQPKIDGVRVILHFVKGVGIFAHSRNVDSQTFRKTDLSRHLLFRDRIPHFSAVVDSEAIVENEINTAPYTPRGALIPGSLRATTAIFNLDSDQAVKLQAEQHALRFHVFDIVNWNGEDLRRRALSVRFGFLASFFVELKALEVDRFMTVVPGHMFGKRLFYDRVISAGGEGVVLKNLNSSYEDSTARDRNAWVKIKASQTLDCYVSGCEHGKPTGRLANKIAILQFSIETSDGPFLVAKVPHISKRLRSTISVKGTQGQTELNKAVLGRWAKIVGVSISPRSFRLTHPRIAKWYPPGKRDDVIWSMAALKESLILQQVLPIPDKNSAA